MAVASAMTAAIATATTTARCWNTIQKVCNFFRFRFVKRMTAGQILAAGLSFCFIA